MEYLNSSGSASTEVVEGPRSGRAARRSFSAEEKRRLVAEYDATPRGQKGVMLRRERLYDSHITEWRAAVAAGTLDAPPKRGRPTGRRGPGPRAGPDRGVGAGEREAAGPVRVDRAGTWPPRDDALEVLGKGVAFLEALSSRNAR